MDNEVTRPECNQSMHRIHERIDKMEKSSIRIEDSVVKIERFAEGMHKIMYGNGRDGLVTKVSNLFITLKIHFWLIGVIVTGLLATAFFVVRNGLK